MRLSIFKQRRKLFSEGDNTQLVMCQDCGHQMETAAGTHALCPKCGGTRFNVVREFFSPNNVPEGVDDPRPDLKKAYETTKKPKKKLFSDTDNSRLSIFNEDAWQREFSMPTSDLELGLRTYSGRTISNSEAENSMKTTASELVEKGFAEYVDSDNIKINDNAFLDSRLFSKLIVSVTKVLDLDPCVTMENDKEKLIDELENHEDMTPKGIMIIKRVHGIIPPEESHDNWIEDSHIGNDLKLEFGGTEKPIHDFKGIIQSRYPDAPEGIMDLLARKGIITIKGNNVGVIR